MKHGALNMYKVREDDGKLTLMKLHQAFLQ
jgi:hypothetical protein